MIPVGKTVTVHLKDREIIDVQSIFPNQKLDLGEFPLAKNLIIAELVSSDRIRVEENKCPAMIMKEHNYAIKS